MNNNYLKKLTFLIPFKQDCEQRLKNIEIVVNYLLKANINVIVGSSSLPVPELDCQVIDMSFKNFHYTKMFNEMAQFVKTDLVALGDGDVLIPYEQINKGCEMALSRTYDIISGYDGNLYNVEPKNYKSEELYSLVTTGEHHCYENIYSSLNIKDFVPYNEKGCVGGCMIYKLKNFYQYGMENENFHGYGYMDNERIDRAVKLGFKYGRVKGPMFHLKHPKTHFCSSKETKNEMKNEFLKVNAMSKAELLEYISSWPWLKNTNWRKYNLIF